MFIPAMTGSNRARCEAGSSAVSYNGRFGRPLIDIAPHRGRFATAFMIRNEAQIRQDDFLTLPDIGHGEISLEPADPNQSLGISKVKKKSTGLSAVVSSLKYSLTQSGAVRGTLPLLDVNQHDGFDCPGCAWPDPDDERSAFEFCENGVKAITHEADSRRADAAFFAKHSVSEMSRRSDYWLEQQGRLTEPMLLDEGQSHYRPIQWDDAFEIIADQLRSLDSPHQAAFYTSGKASNEAAFVYQLMVRMFGTNNLPDCSNMCHESSGRALTKMFGLGKGTVKLDDFAKSELVIVSGQNPGTNHPRQLTALQQAKRNGAKIIAVNPLPEAGLMGFMNPQEPLGLLGKSTTLTDLFLQIKIGGDIALFKGIAKALIAWDEQQRGSAIDWDFVDGYCSGIEETIAEVKSTSWEAIENGSGIAREQITQAATWIRQSKKIIMCWCLGVTQHARGTEAVQEMMNVLLMRGSIGIAGGGSCPVRGHSNVQGDRTMGVWEKLKPELAEKLRENFGFEPPLDDGTDSQRTAVAMHNGEIKVFVSLGGNFQMAMSDTRYIAEAIRKTNLTVRIGTKLNRADLVTGKRSLILPCLGRTEWDRRQTADGGQVDQITSCENSMGVIQSSRGKRRPASERLRGEVDILCSLAKKLLGQTTSVPWDDWRDDYDLVRDAIAQTIAGCQRYNEKVRQDGGFYLPNGPRIRQFKTADGKAHFTTNAIVDLTPPSGQFAMTSVRSHDQFNTTIYGLDDRYRGIHRDRRIVMMNPQDMRENGLNQKSKVRIDTAGNDNSKRTLVDYTAVSYPVPRGCVVMYYPECNALIPIEGVDRTSNCPSFKHTPVKITKQ